MGTFMTGFTWEVNLMEWMQATFPDFLKNIFSFFTYLGSEAALVVILLLVYFCLNKKLGEKMIVSSISATTFGAGIKNLVLRLRPYFSNPSIECLQPVDSSADLYDVNAQAYSFPSLHSANAITIYASFLVFTKKKSFIPLAIILPLLIGISRSVVGCHYPTDVIAGWAIGLIILFAVDLMYKKLKKPVMFIILLAVASIGCFFAKSNDYYSGLGLMIGFFTGSLFEEKHSNFEDTTSILSKFLRILGAGIIFFGLDTLLKLPFSAEFLDSATAGQFIFRTIRYTFMIFIIVGIYPMVFKYYDKIKSNKEKAKSN